MADKPNLSEVRDLEDYQKAFHSKWDSMADDPILKPFQSELRQINQLLAAYLHEVFSGDFVIGWFTGRDIYARNSDGYQVLTIGDFPPGKWSDSIAARMKLKNAVDGTIRWGRRQNVMAAVIRTDKRAKILERQAMAAEEMYKRHLPPGRSEEADGSETEMAYERGESVVPGPLKKARGRPRKK